VACAGLCQAKIAAAELWRAYSEHYRSHQARHPAMSITRHRHHQHHHHRHEQQQQQQVKPLDVTDRGTGTESAAPAEPTDAPHQSSPVQHHGVEKVAVVVDDAAVGRRDNGDVIGAPTGCGGGSGSSGSSSSNDGDAPDDDSEVELGVDVLSGLGSGGSPVWNDHEDDSSDGPTTHFCRATLY